LVASLDVTIEIDDQVIVLGSDIRQDLGGLIDVPFEGTIDDVRVYSRALSDAEIQLLATP
jgi:hypothetical protein